jgi:hypothetical protein
MSVVVLTWNVWCHQLVGGGQSRTRLLRLVGEIKQIGPHVVCVQELFLGKLLGWSFAGDLQYFCDALKELGYVALSTTATSPWLFGQNSGLVTFYRASSLEFVRFNECIFEHPGEWLANKGLVLTSYAGSSG